MAHQVEHRLLGDRRDAAAHLAEQPMIPIVDERERPDQRIAERSTRLGGEDQLADVDEAADRGQDPEGQLKRIEVSSICLTCPRARGAARRRIVSARSTA